MRIITASARFDGHDVSINIFRRLLIKKGVEVIHMGHNRSVEELVKASIEEDADALLVSSYQGGHNEYFKHLIDCLKKIHSTTMIFGGGGGVMQPSEISDLQQYGVEKIYHAIEGREMGLNGIIEDILHRVKNKKIKKGKNNPFGLENNLNRLHTGRNLSLLENLFDYSEIPNNTSKKLSVIGITGPGGSGKSSITDELVNRFLKTSNEIKIAVIAIDPTKKNSGGGLLGDRIRMNSIYSPRVFMRSMATRDSSSEIGDSLKGILAFMKKIVDLVIVETSGIGQGDSEISTISDLSIYVMTAEFGAPSQLEKIEMLDEADFIVVNKASKPGSEDAIREVRMLIGRNRGAYGLRSASNESLPVYATNANKFNDPGINLLFTNILDSKLFDKNNVSINSETVKLLPKKIVSFKQNNRADYLARVADIIDEYKNKAETNIEIAENCFALKQTSKILSKENKNSSEVDEIFNFNYESLDETFRKFIEKWPQLKKEYESGRTNYQVREKNIEVNTKKETFTGIKIPKVALPDYSSWGELARFYFFENLPGYFPYTAGLFPFKKETEETRRLFAGEGGPEKTNRRLHYLTGSDEFKRLSIAFDGVTLYGEDPDTVPDIFGKIGESGVSVATLDDMKKLMDGFNLSDPSTSVSMTINGPAPVMLAFYFVVALKEAEKTRGPFSKEAKIDLFRKLRGTVQADILKEDQGQNTCIFSIDFALKMMGDIQEYFSKNKIKSYYTVSISGYHIAEAGANPITQLAFTLANGFHYVEYFLSRGLKVDEFVENFSFFFSIGMEAEYSVIGRVARRIWAIAMRDIYKAGSRGQKLKYHIQTSGRSLHARDLGFNDIRTTLQALMAYNDNCNSLHTNSADEAITTPTEDSVRRAVAIQLIIAKEFGPSLNENNKQGAFIINELTNLVEEAVLKEFRNISRRGGVLAAMETQYQRSRIQEESIHYEQLKENGQIPIIGVNTFQSAEKESGYESIEITRSTIEEKEKIVANLTQFKKKNSNKSKHALESLKTVILSDENIFAELLNTVEHATLGEITELFYTVGGRYRRNM